MITGTDTEGTCSGRREDCYDDQTKQDPKDAKHATENKLGGFVSVTEVREKLKLI